MRTLKITVVALVLLLLVADRVGAVVASHVIATRLQTAGSLSAKPDVSIRGFPFLTQAISGRYDRIELTSHDLSRGSIDLKRFQVDVTGARVPLSDALRGHVSSIPVEGLKAELLVGYTDLAARSRLPLTTMTRAGREVQLSASMGILGQRVRVRVLSSVVLEGTTLVVAPRQVSVDVNTADVIRTVTPLLELRIPLGTLPYGLRLTGLKVVDGGVLLSATSGPTVLQRP